MSAAHRSLLEWAHEWDLGAELTMARTHVVMSDAVLEAIDRKVGQRSRSRFLEEAAREKLARLELEDSLLRTRGVTRGSRYRHWRDRAATEKWVRAGRKANRRP